MRDNIRGGNTSSPPCSVAGTVKLAAGLKVGDSRLTNDTYGVQVEADPEIY